MRVFSKNRNRSDRECADDELLRSLFERYFDRLVYFAFKLIGDKDSANDLVQEAFIKFWQLRANIETTNEIAVKNFLYSTVKNSALNVIRHQKVASRYALLAAEEELFEEAVVEHIISAEVLDSLRSAILSLPEPYQKIGVMAYLEGKKNQEIADELEMSVNTVKKQKQKVLELLKLKLTPEMLLALVVLAG